MGQISWYRRYPDQALQGMFELSLEERGAYNTLLDLIYVRDNKLPDDDRFVAGWLRCDMRVWKRIKNRLLDLKKIRLEDGFIRNPKADEEVLRALGRVLSAREAGLASASSRASKSKANPNKINDLALTPVEGSVQRPFQLDRDREEKKKEREDKSSPKKASAWQDGDPAPGEWIVWAVADQRWSEQKARYEAQRFIDYALANRRTYVDWMAAWRNWCRSPYQKPTPAESEQRRLTI